MLTSVYGPRDDPVKSPFWAEIRSIRNWVLGPWVMCGDFNTMRFSSERTRGIGSMRDMELFGDLIRDLNLVDLPLGGRSFTWSNKREVASFAKLDRLLVSDDWEARYLLVTQKALQALVFDHSAILLVQESALPKRKNFRFKKMWTLHYLFDELVATWWFESPSREDPTSSFVLKF